jgi:hypothetical protein
MISQVTTSAMNSCGKFDIAIFSQVFLEIFSIILMHVPQENYLAERLLK